VKAAPFDYEAPTTLGDALDLLRDNEDARPIAGGQSLVPMLALRLARPALLVDLNRIERLSRLSMTGELLRIGATVRQADVLRSDVVARHAPLLIETLHNVGHPPTRARGTIGGSLAHADPAAELPVAMIALDAEMIVTSANGERVIPAEDFFRGAFETALKPGEMLVAVDVPKQAGTAAFIEVAPRKGDFAIVSVAARLIERDGTCASCALVLGGIADRPIRCSETEAALAGEILDDSAIAGAVAELPLDAVTMDSRLASASYRKRLIPTLVRRALASAISRGAVP